MSCMRILAEIDQTIQQVEGDLSDSTPESSEAEASVPAPGRVDEDSSTDISQEIDAEFAQADEYFQDLRKKIQAWYLLA